MRKKGVSAVVAVVLTVLITFVGVVIILVGVFPIIDIDEGSTFEVLEEHVSIVDGEGYTLYDASREVAIVQVRRDFNDDVISKVQISFVIEGNSVSSSVVAPNLGETNIYAFNLSGYGEPESVRIAPIFVSGDSEILGEITSDVDILSGMIAEINWEIYELDGGTPVESCFETDVSCGIFPGCNNCDSLDVCTGAILTDYSCVSNTNGCASVTIDCSGCSCSCDDYGQADESAFCSDGKDNDCDGDVDGADLDCTIPCDLTNAYWSDVFVSNGTVVWLIVEGSNCDGESVNFSIWEDDLIGDDFVGWIVGSYDNVSWVSAYQDDAGGDPEFYFEAVLISNPGESVNSQDEGNALLDVGLLPGCGDSVRNQDETDVDCGGSICGACGIGMNCSIGSDCASVNCVGGICVAAESCVDGLLNQDEVGVDCGGVCVSGVETGFCTGGVDDDNDCAVDCGDSDCSLDSACVSSCSGTPHDCSVFTVKKDCNNHGGGCSWNNKLKVCQGVHDVCSVYVDGIMCAGHGCVWG